MKERQMNKALVAEMGIEGGGITIYVGKSEGVWSFWTEGTSTDLDENDDEVWRSWSSEQVSSVDLLLPKEWLLFCPVEIHPDFVGWFRDAYERARALLPEDQRRSLDGHRHRRWSEILGMPR
jgi:hypothetical protein